MLKRDELVKYLDQLLEVDQWAKVDSSLNGLQVEGADKIERVAFAVDACEETFRLCREAGCGMLLVHHGLFWGKPLPVTGAHRRRVALLIESGVSLYAAHLPLDFHPKLGHNACIARGLELETIEALSYESGLPVGILAKAKSPIEVQEFTARVDRLLDTTSRLLPFGSRMVQNVGIVSGSGSRMLDEALSRKIDTFLTGEPSHTLYHFAKEYGVNVIFSGHYATETPGLKELSTHLEGRFGIETVFFDAPTGL